MHLKILSGSANFALAKNVAGKLGAQLVTRILEGFPDGELHIELRESVRGDDVFIIQPTAPNVDEHLFELLLLSDACRHAGRNLSRHWFPTSATLGRIDALAVESRSALD